MVGEATGFLHLGQAHLRHHGRVTNSVRHDFPTWFQKLRVITMP
jgi:hypothetical protein